MLTSRQSERILQTHARKVLDNYPWERFKEIIHKLHEQGIGNELGAFPREKQGEADGALWPTMPNAKPTWRPIRNFHAFETAFRDFVSWVVGLPITEHSVFGSDSSEVRKYDDPIPPNLRRHHSNSVGQLLMIHKDGVAIYAKYAENEESIKRAFMLHTHQHLERQQLCETLAFLYDYDESFITYPIYLPEYFAGVKKWEMFRVIKEVASMLESDLMQIDSDKNNGMAILLEMLKEKIPLFPPEAHELRLRILDETPELLNALYDATSSFDLVDRYTCTDDTDIYLDWARNFLYLREDGIAKDYSNHFLGIIGYLEVIEDLAQEGDMDGATEWIKKLREMGYPTYKEYLKAKIEDWNNAHENDGQKLDKKTTMQRLMQPKSAKEIEQTSLLIKDILGREEMDLAQLLRLARQGRAFVQNDLGSLMPENYPERTFDILNKVTAP